MNKDITISITQNSDLIIMATITQCGGAPASEYLAAIKLLTNQISGELDADALDIDLSLDDALAYRDKITKITSNQTTAGKFACTGCLALASIDMPNMTTIGDYAFARTQLSGEFADTFKMAKTIGLGAFDRCQFASVDLSGTESIGPRAFRAGNIKKVWLPKEISITAESMLDAPFIGNEDINVMIYTDCPDEAAARAKWGEFFDNVSEMDKAPVLYNETHDSYLQE